MPETVRKRSGAENFIIKKGDLLDSVRELIQIAENLARENRAMEAA